MLYNFTGGDDGAEPTTALIRDANGNFYGTTVGGGSANAGVVFKLSPRGREEVLYTFAGGSDGANPGGGLTMDSNGNLYGTASRGGDNNGGVVFVVRNRAQPAQ